MTRTLFAALLTALAATTPAAAIEAARSRPAPAASSLASATDVTWTTASFDLALDADGRITRLEALPRTNPQVAAKLMPRIRGWQFRVRGADGTPASAETTLYVHLRGERVEGSERYDVRISSAFTGPRAIHSPVPRYPHAALVAHDDGGVMAKVTVNADGSTSTVEPIAELSDRRFQASAVHALSQWRYMPERINGRGVASEIRLPVVYKLAGMPLPKLKWNDERAKQPHDAMAVLDSPVQLLAADF